jgi:hypothetical protein
MNFELTVKEIKLETFMLTGRILDEKILNNLINAVKNNKDDILSYKTNVKGHFTGFKSLINNEDLHSFLKLIQPCIFTIYNKNFVISDAWGNICKKGGEIIEHDHGDHDFAFCGILYLSNGGPGTYFRDYDITINEEIGKYVLFHPKLLHCVKKIENDIDRITIAFNMGKIKDWDQDLNKLTWVNKNEI